MSAVGGVTRRHDRRPPTPSGGQQPDADQGGHRERLDDRVPVSPQAGRPEPVDEPDGERHERRHDPHDAVPRNETGEQGRGHPGDRTDQDTRGTSDTLAHTQAEPDTDRKTAAGRQQHVVVHAGDRVRERDYDDPDGDRGLQSAPRHPEQPSGRPANALSCYSRHVATPRMVARRRRAARVCRRRNDSRRARRVRYDTRRQSASCRAMRSSCQAGRRRIGSPQASTRPRDRVVNPWAGPR